MSLDSLHMPRLMCADIGCCLLELAEVTCYIHTFHDVLRTLFNRTCIRHDTYKSQQIMLVVKASLHS